METYVKAELILQDGSVFKGYSFGYQKNVSAEVVFSTGMTGYDVSLTDPSFEGQIIVMTYPLAGNYGVPSQDLDKNGISLFLESPKIHAKGLIVSDYCEKYSHYNAVESLSSWLVREQIPALFGIDTRELTKRIREKGVMTGRIVFQGLPDEAAEEDYDNVNFVDRVSCKEIIRYGEGAAKKVVLLDCGVKHNILRCLIDRGVEVIRVPWNHDFTSMEYDGLFISNGPGSPEHCGPAVLNIRKAMAASDKPVFGICMGNQLLAKAGGASVYKLKYGHRGHNQPVRMTGTNRCFITSQNHGFAVDEKTLGTDWEPFFVNLNDGSNEGIRHKTKPWFSVQFHPEAEPGPTDTEFLFDDFIKLL